MPETVADHPHATLEQAKDMASAVLHGDENARGVVVEGIEQQQYLPGTKGDD